MTKKHYVNIFLEIKPTSGANPVSKKKFDADFKDLIKKEHNKNNHRNIVEMDVRVNAIFHFKDEHPGDVDNLLKNLFDGLEGTIIKNDKQIKKISAEIQNNSFVEGISLIVSEI